MMSPRRRTGRARLVLSLVAVVVGGLMVWAVTLYAARGHGKGQLEIRDEFRVGHASALVDQVPFLLPDATPGRSVDIYVQHDPGAAVDTGWLAFSAYAPGQRDRECFLRYSEEDEVFRDPCTDEEFPPDGTGLTQYKVRVDDDDRVHISLATA
jgi:hypothetical protein